MNKGTKIAIAIASTICFGLGIFFFIKSKKTASGGEKKMGKLKNPNPKKILILGDSFTSDVKGAYSRLVKDALTPKGIETDIVFKSGAETSWMVNALKNQLQSNKYDRIYFYGGINDAFALRDVDDILGRVQNIVDMGNQNGADVFVVKGYVIDNMCTLENLKPTKYITTKEAFIPLVQRYKEYRAKLNENNIKNANWVQQFDLKGNTGDGTHPNGTGYKIIADEILKTI